MLWRHVVRTPVDYGGFDRRHVSRGLYLEELEGESVNVRVAVDTSGSVGQQDLRRFVAELREIIRLYPHINASLYFADAGPLQLAAVSSRQGRESQPIHEFGALRLC